MSTVDTSLILPTCVLSIARREARRPSREAPEEQPSGGELPGARKLWTSWRVRDLYKARGSVASQ